MERWRDGEMERWRDGEMERWRWKDELVVCILAKHAWLYDEEHLRHSASFIENGKVEERLLLKYDEHHVIADQASVLFGREHRAHMIHDLASAPLRVVR
jgi:hypothetical protein